MSFFVLFHPKCDNCEDFMDENIADLTTLLWPDHLGITPKKS